MFEEEYRKEMSQVKLSQEQKERMTELMTAAPVRGIRRTGRMALAAAAVIVLCVCSAAAAYAMGAFDFLKERDEYALLGQGEVYETCAYDVKRSATAENGDVLTVDRVAMDGKFCTIFYSVRFQESVVSTEELGRIQGGDKPELWQLWKIRSAQFSLFAGEEEISLETYEDSFETMQYLADENTMYGAWRFLLRTPLEEGEQVRFQAQMWDPQTPDGKYRSTMLWDLSLEFEAHPIQEEHFELNAAIPLLVLGETTQVEAVSFDRSPLGAQLTLRSEELNWGLSGEFALRDADTGEYIPYAEVVTNHSFDPEGYFDKVYELYGDVRDLKNLELIPVRQTGDSVAPRQTVSLDELPSTDTGNPAGGYAPASYTVGDGQIIVTMQPVGAATGYYARILNGVSFLDEDGNDLFRSTSVQKFKNRQDGTITVVMTPDAESFREDIEKVAQIWFFVHQYELLEDQTVLIPLA